MDAKANVQEPGQAKLVIGLQFIAHVLISIVTYSSCYDDGTYYGWDKALLGYMIVVGLALLCAKACCKRNSTFEKFVIFMALIYDFISCQADYANGSHWSDTDTVCTIAKSFMFSYQKGRFSYSKPPGPVTLILHGFGFVTRVVFAKEKWNFLWFKHKIQEPKSADLPLPTSIQNQGQIEPDEEHPGTETDDEESVTGEQEEASSQSDIWTSIDSLSDT